VAKTVNEILDMSDAVNYHHGQFPPRNINYQKLISPLARASSTIARYDQMLKAMHNSEILLTPLRSQEAVVSSRMEGTISTLDEVLRYDAEQEEDGSSIHKAYRHETIEVWLYGRALRTAQANIEKGTPISSWLIRTTHKQLLGYGRGASKSPGEFKKEQNYLADQARRKILFQPIDPEHLQDGLDRLFTYIDDPSIEILIRTAVAHLEFEALHPFKDGNGRIGRMLITLMLWHYGILSAPHFYVSAYFEQNRDEYIDTMREVSKTGDWTDWIIFFLDGLDQQARENLLVAEKIRELYESMKERLREELSSKWSTMALDFLFERPVFRNNVFTNKSGIPPQTAHRFTRQLLEAGILRMIDPASGRRPAMYSFEPLLKLVRG